MLRPLCAGLLELVSDSGVRPPQRRQGPRGGLRDKPGKAQDHYHTCYCLSGLAAAQMYSGTVLGPGGNALREIDILLNVRTDRAEAFAELLRRSGVA